MNRWLRGRLPVLLLAFLLFGRLLPAEDTVPLLFAAIRSGDAEQVRGLLAAGVEVESRDAQGLTALMRAAEAGYADIVQELLRRGAQLDATIAFYGITALKLAERAGNGEIVRMLLSAGARPDIGDRRDGRPILGTRLE